MGRRVLILPRSLGLVLAVVIAAATGCSIEPPSEAAGAVTALPTPSPAPTTALPPTSTTELPPTSTTTRSTATAIVRNGGNVRDRPTIEGSTVLDQVHAGETLVLQGRTADASWYLALNPRGIEGWVHTSLLAVDPLVAADLPVETGERQRSLRAPGIGSLAQPSAQASYQEIEGYTAGGTAWRNILIPPGLDGRQLIVLARDLHAQAPEASFQIFDDTGQFEQYKQWDVNNPNAAYPLPDEWARQHLVAQIRQLFTPRPGRWVLIMEPLGEQIVVDL